MASAIQNPLYECSQSREAEDIVSLGRAAEDRAAQAWTRLSNFDTEVKKRTSFLVTHLRAQQEALMAAQRELEALI